jgi:uncharacterized membrane protein
MALAGMMLVCLSAPGWAARPSFQGLGYHPDGAAHTQVSDVSADGRVVIGRTELLGRPKQAFRWTEEEGMLPLTGLPEGMSDSSAWAVSGDGEVIVGDWVEPDPASPYGSITRAFTWTQSGGMVPLAGVPTDNWHTAANGVSADGRTIVGNMWPGRCFQWVASEGVTFLGALGGHYWSGAIAVSADGSAVAGYSDNYPTSTQAWRWTASEGLVGLGDLPGGRAYSNATAVSADGTTVVGWSKAAEGSLPFRWTAEEGMVSLGDLPGGDVYGLAVDVSADGAVVVGRSESAAGREAFIWDQAHGIRSLKTVLTEEYGLDLSGWQLERAEAISDDGITIVGQGVNPLGFDEAWVAALPEPSIAAILILGAGAIAAGKRRFRSTAALGLG